MSHTTSTVNVPRTRVSLAIPEAARYWCARFDCTPAELHKAVNVVGDSPEAIERILDIERQFEPFPGSRDGARMTAS